MLLCSFLLKMQEMWIITWQINYLCMWGNSANWWLSRDFVVICSWKHFQLILYYFALGNQGYMLRKRKCGVLAFIGANISLLSFLCSFDIFKEINFDLRVNYQRAFDFKVSVKRYIFYCATFVYIVVIVLSWSFNFV